MYLPDILKALANERRLLILHWLKDPHQHFAEQEHPLDMGVCCKLIDQRTGLSQSTVSAHLACLRDCGLVDFRAQGRQSFYFLARSELLDLLVSAEAVLAATGEAVALCPVYGAEPETA